MFILRLLRLSDDILSGPGEVRYSYIVEEPVIIEMLFDLVEVGFKAYTLPWGRPAINNGSLIFF
jgi:hypothetical protein